MQGCYGHMGRSKDMRTGMDADMHVGMCIGMPVDMCTDACTEMLLAGQFEIPARARSLLGRCYYADGPFMQ